MPIQDTDRTGKVNSFPNKTEENRGFSTIRAAVTQRIGRCGQLDNEVMYVEHTMLDKTLRRYVG